VPPDIAFVVATDETVRAAVYLFREEMAPHEPGGTPRVDERGLRDSLDHTAIVVAAIDRARRRVVATARTNLIRHGLVPLYGHLYGLDVLPEAERDVSSVTTGWAIAPHVGRLDRWTPSDVAIGVAWTLFNIAMQERVRHDYLDCPDAHVPFFLRLGYRLVRPIQHPSRGRVNLMRLDVFDWTHLAEVASPFLTLATDTRG